MLQAEENLSMVSVGSGESKGPFQTQERLLGKQKPRVEGLLHHTSPQSQDVLQTQLLGFLKMAGNLVPALPTAGHVQDGFQATVVHSSAGDHHGGGLFV
jgi:hypothetical protein